MSAENPEITTPEQDQNEQSVTADSSREEEVHFDAAKLVEGPDGVMSPKRVVGPGGVVLTQEELNDWDHK